MRPKNGLSVLNVFYLGYWGGLVTACAGIADVV